MKMHECPCGCHNGELPDSFTPEEVAHALDEAMLEVERGRGVLWRSFWDRLTAGGPIPQRIDPDEHGLYRSAV